MSKIIKDANGNTVNISSENLEEALLNSTLSAELDAKYEIKEELTEEYLDKLSKSVGFKIFPISRITIGENTEDAIVYSAADAQKYCIDSASYLRMDKDAIICLPLKDILAKNPDAPIERFVPWVHSDITYLEPEFKIAFAHNDLQGNVDYYIVIIKLTNDFNSPAQEVRIGFGISEK